MLFYSNNIVTHSIGIVFYHNGEYSGGYFDDWLESEEHLNVVIPSKKILKLCLKLDEVHVFGNLSKSGIIEKIDYLIEKSNIYMLEKA